MRLYLLLALFFFIATSSFVPYTCGLNSYGELGQNNQNLSLVPVSNSNLKNVVSVSVGNQFSLFVTSDGSIYSVGSNSYGQLGINSLTDSYTLQLVSTTNVIMASAGDSHSLVLQSNGNAFAFGNNANGRLCLGVAGGLRNAPTMIKTVSNIVYLSAGFYHSILVTNAGQVYTCGLGTSGQLGLGTFTSQTSPTLVSNLNNIVSAAGGSDNSFFINSTGSVFATGSNTFGVFGTGTTGSVSTSILLTDPAFQNVSKISVNANHALYLTTNGNVYSVGSNDFGQLGLGDNVQRLSPVLLAIDVTSISTSKNSSYILFGNSSVYSFGKNDYGELCLGDFVTRFSPTYINITDSPIRNVQNTFSFSAVFLGCPFETYGANCEYGNCFGIRGDNVDVCSGNGQCNFPNNCTCNIGWTGQTCSNPICFGVNSTNSQVCSGNGICNIPDQCICNSGFSGIDCRFIIKPTTYCFGIQAIDSRVCNGFGACVGDNQCICNTYNYGDQCQYQTFYWNPKFSIGKWTDLSWLVKTDYGYIPSTRSPNFGDVVFLSLPGTVAITLDIPLNISNITIGGYNSQYTFIIQSNQIFKEEIDLLENSQMIIENSVVTVENFFNISGTITYINSIMKSNNKLIFKNNLIIPMGSQVIINSEDLNANGFIINGDLILNSFSQSPNININMIQINSGSFNLFSNITLSNTFINITNGNFNLIGGKVQGSGIINNNGYFQVFTNYSKTSITGITILNNGVFEITGGSNISCSIFIPGPQSLFSLKGSSVSFNSPLNVNQGGFQASGTINIPYLNLSTTDLFKIYPDKPLFINGDFILGDTTTLMIELSDILKSQEKILIKNNIILNGLIYLKVANQYNIEVGDQFKFISSSNITIGNNTKLMLIGSTYKTAQISSTQTTALAQSFIQHDVLQSNTQSNNQIQSIGLEIVLSLGNLQFANEYRCNYLGNRRIIEVVYFQENKKAAITLTTPVNSGWSAFGVDKDENLTNAKIIAFSNGNIYEIFNHTRISSQIISFIDTGAFQAQSLFGIGKEYLSMTMLVGLDILLNENYIFYVENPYELLSNQSTHYTFPIYNISLLNDQLTPCTNFVLPSRLETTSPISIAIVLFIYVISLGFCVVLYKFQPLYSRGLAPITTLVFLIFQLGFETRNYDYIPSEQTQLCLYLGYILFPLQQISFVMIIFYFIRYFSIISLNTLKNNITIVNKQGKEVTKYSWRVIILKQLSKIWFISFLILIYLFFTLIVTTIILASYQNFICTFNTISSLKIANSVLMLMIFFIVFAVILGDILMNYQHIFKCQFYTYIFKKDPYFFRVQIFMFLPFMIYTLASEIVVLLKIQTFVEIVLYNQITEILNTINYNLLYLIEVVFPIILTFYNLIVLCRKPPKSANTIVALLNNPEGYELFVNFSKKEYSVENVYAWKDCTDFRKNYLKDKPRMNKIKKVKLEGDKRQSNASSLKLNDLEEIELGPVQMKDIKKKSGVSQNNSTVPIEDISTIPRENFAKTTRKSISETKEEFLSSNEIKESYICQAEEIYLKYFNGDQSMFEVNVTKSSCQMIYDQITLKMVDETIFDEIIEDILVNMKDIYFRLQQSYEYKVYISKHKLENELLEKENDTFIVKKLEKKKQEEKQETIKRKSQIKAKLEEISKRKLLLKNGVYEFDDYTGNDENPEEIPTTEKIEIKIEEGTSENKFEIINSKLKRILKVKTEPHERISIINERDSKPTSQTNIPPLGSLEHPKLMIPIDKRLSIISNDQISIDSMKGSFEHPKLMIPIDKRLSIISNEDLLSNDSMKGSFEHPKLMIPIDKRLSIISNEDQLSNDSMKGSFDQPKLNLSNLEIKLGALLNQDKSNDVSPRKSFENQSRSSFNESKDIRLQLNEEDLLSRFNAKVGEVIENEENKGLNDLSE